MNKEDEKLLKHLVDEMMKVSQTNPDVILYLEALMKKYEELEQELDKYKNIVDELKKENEKLHKQVREYQDEIFARDNNWYDMCD